jgi:hypothetical protein
MKAGEDVEVVFRAVDAIEVALAALQDTSDVPEEVLAPVTLNGRLTVLGGEDDVITNLRMR